VASTLDLPVSASGASALDVAWRCGRVAGDLALSRFRGAHAIDIKGHRNIVTATDVEAELLVKDVLAEEYPTTRSCPRRPLPIPTRATAGRGSSTR
jgi:hypothetical protein